MRKAIYIAAALLLTFASADATGRRTTRSKIQVVYREQANGEWQTYIFGPACYGKLELKTAHDPSEPITIVCK